MQEIIVELLLLKNSRYLQSVSGFQRQMWRMQFLPLEKKNHIKLVNL